MVKTVYSEGSSTGDGERAGCRRVYPISASFPTLSFFSHAPFFFRNLSCGRKGRYAGIAFNSISLFLRDHGYDFADNYVGNCVFFSLLPFSDSAVADNASDNATHAVD